MSSAGPTTLTVVTYNVRHAVLDEGADAWANRRAGALALLGSLAPDVLGLQESTGDQQADVEDGLDGYTWTGVGDPGSGAHNPVGVDGPALVGGEVCWLSETPAVESVGWDGSYARVLTRADLSVAGRRLTVFNTHFDHEGPTARAESARLLRRRVGALPPDRPAVVLGDLNCRPGSEPYGILTGDGPLVDARAAAATTEGPATTVTDFEALDPGRRLDHVLVTPGVGVDRYAAVDRRADGRYPSDHLPVLARIRLA